MTARAARGAVAATLVATALTGCGSHPAPPHRRAPGSTPAAARTARPHAALGVGLRVVASRSLPAPVQLPGLARVGTTVLAAGGLDSADSSMADIVRVAPGAARRVGALPFAAHDVGAAALGSSVYVFGGGTAGGPIDAITQVTPSGRSRLVGHLPVGDVGYDRGDDRRDGLHRRRLHHDHPAALGARLPPGRGPREVAALPHPLRYAAAAAVGGAHARRRRHRRHPRRATRSSASTPPAIACGSSAACRPRSRTPPARRSATPSTSSAGAATRPPASAAASGRSIPRTRAACAPAGRLPVGALGPRRAVAAGDRLRGGRRSRRRGGGVHDELLELGARAHASRPAPPARARGRLASAPARRATTSTRPIAGALRHGRAATRARLRAQLAVEHRRRHRSAHRPDRRPLRRRRAAAARHPVVGPAHAVGHQRQRQQPHADRPAHRAPRPAGRRSRDPYNLYFTADGRRAIVVAEARRELDFREPHTMRLRHALHVPAVRRRRPHGLHRRRPPRARLVRVRRADDRRRPAPRAGRQDDRAARRARCPRTSSSRPTGARSTSPTWRPTASG